LAAAEYQQWHTTTPTREGSGCRKKRRDTMTEVEEIIRQHTPHCPPPNVGIDNNYMGRPEDLATTQGQESKRLTTSYRGGNLCLRHQRLVDIAHIMEIHDE